MDRRLQVDADRCTGCGLCQLACAVSKSRQFDPSLARITIYRRESLGLNLPLICQQCAHPPCMAVCLMDAVRKDPAAGITIRDIDRCIGCRACQIACPFEACTYDHIHGVVVNCDLCGDNPACVDICPTGALQYRDVDAAPAAMREAAGSKRSRVLDLERRQRG